MKWLLLLVSFTILAAMPATAGLVLDPDDVAWTTVADIVTFTMRFHNPDPVESEPATGDLVAYPFGAFLEGGLPVGNFDIPPIPPDSFFDVTFDVPLDQLPPTADEILPWIGKSALDFCPQDWHWDGNVDVIWNGPSGGGSTQVHHGTLQVCSGYGGSYIHVATNCPGNVGWNITGVCAGFTATLVNEDLSPAPNPLMPGWTGHIAVSAVTGTPLGTTCCLTVNFTCGGVTVPVKLCVVTCDCGPIENEHSSWGYLKSLYR